ncbi:FCD domain-containing protein [Aminivibrio sp.]|uniref:FCD domain-containing protein n=1 Tax=Aminivibrio sp. TaxID=1872489 RepID=UPI001A3AD99B|nr:FCD domain-containing protein [Aminivibrio sp.]MBL3539349.1 FCD domain-containing protein [Aminivibrio sp.]MDK2959619.1 hypothetical protein [Synergistaceae bacterium]
MRLCLETHTMELACEVRSSEDPAALEANLQLRRFAIGDRDATRFFSLDEDFNRLVFAACGKERIREPIGEDEFPVRQGAGAQPLRHLRGEGFLPALLSP